MSNRLHKSGPIKIIQSTGSQKMTFLRRFNQKSQRSSVPSGDYGHMKSVPKGDPPAVNPFRGIIGEKVSATIYVDEVPADVLKAGGSVRQVLEGKIKVPVPSVTAESETRKIWRGNIFSKRIPMPRVRFNQIPKW